ncbi:MAG: hypothetical protein WAN86_15555 [Hyphomicrobiaceae bacterium]
MSILVRRVPRSAVQRHRRSIGPRACQVYLTIKNGFTLDFLGLLLGSIPV